MSGSVSTTAFVRVIDVGPTATAPPVSICIESLVRSATKIPVLSPVSVKVTPLTTPACPATITDIGLLVAEATGVAVSRVSAAVVVVNVTVIVPTEIAEIAAVVVNGIVTVAVFGSAPPGVPIATVAVPSVRPAPVPATPTVAVVAPGLALKSSVFTIVIVPEVAVVVVTVMPLILPAALQAHL